MCGISGIYRKQGALVDNAILRRMAESIHHRGPDDSGVYVDGRMGLAHTRLSIIDLSPLGHQPMQSDDGRFVIAYNGEIYNFRELRKILEGNGHRFRGRSDTEVALHAYAEWGEAAFAKFEGMFAMAVWDRQAQRLQLARDRFGIKPLYYYCSPSGELIFGSEIKALLASGEVDARIGWQGLHEYMHYCTALGANTMFEGIAKLLPGHALTLDSGGVKCEPYVSILNPDDVRDDLPTATRTVRSLLEASVQSHLVSDVPVGVFLSGGIDSSAITAFASQHYGGRLRTFSAGFDFDGGVNELPEARLVAEHFGTEHHELHVSGGNVADVIEKLLRCHDEPFADPANIPLYLLCEQLAGEVKVVLQGDGGDEMFAGYDRYVRLSQFARWRLIGRAVHWLHPLARRLTGGQRALMGHAAFATSNPKELMAGMMSTEPVYRPPNWVFARVCRSLLESKDPGLRYKELHQRLEQLDAVQRMLYTDASILLPDLYFEKVDKPTMAHGIEVRVPMVDTCLASYAMGLPSAYKVRGNEKKYVLRRALRGILPDSILDRPKTGFGVPMDNWLRTSLANYLKSVLFDPSTRHTELFDYDAVSRCVREHKDQRWNNGPLLYKILNLVLWLKEYRVGF